MKRKQTTTVNVGTRLASLIRRVGDPIMVRYRQDGGVWVDHGMSPHEITPANIHRIRTKRTTVKELRRLDALPS